MCSRYRLADANPPEELLELIADLERRGKSGFKLGEIRPTDAAPVIANNRAGEPTPFVMRWGFTCNGAPVINARSETAVSKPLFRESMARRRCLIPASYYFEWEKRTTGKVKYAIGAGNLVYLAGLYRLEDSGPVFTILTRAPAEQIAFIHNRMPVILPRSVHREWLNGEPPDAILRAAELDVTFRTAE